MPNCSRASPRRGTSATRCAPKAFPTSLTLPLLHAVADTVTDPRASRALLAAAGSADKTERGYEGYVHALFNETGREAVIADLTTWLEQRVPEARRLKLTRVADAGLSTPASP